MENRKIEFIGEIPLNKINLFIKLIHNLCKDTVLNKLHISSNDIILSLLNEHVEAIANEDVNYIDLEKSVRKTINK
ncbi:MAG: hypothetical protein M0Q13_14020 [Methanothrix sp.]|jgi:hypothetical protein|nr:hypothetical protein [Methanothrix sp.]